MVGKHKTRSLMLIASGLAIWAGCTAFSSYLNYQNYMQQSVINAEKKSIDIEKYFEIYGDLLNSFNALFESSRHVTREEMERYFHSWKPENSIANPKDKIIAYGLYSGEDEKSSYFIPVVDDVSLKFYRSHIISHDNGNDFSVYHDLPGIEYSGPAREYFTISTHYQGNEMGHGDHIFLMVDKNATRSRIRELLFTGSENYTAEIYWNAPPAEKIKSGFYVDTVKFGNGIVHVIYTHAKPWSVFSSSNSDGLVWGFFSSLFLFLLYFYVLQAAHSSKKSENDKRNAEKKLAEQAHFFESFLENMPAVLFVKDAADDYKYYMFNKEAEAFFGYSREQMIGRTDRDLFNDEEANFFRTIDEATMLGRKVIDIPCEVVTTKSGETFVHTRKVPIYDSEGNPQFLIGLAQDITKRKKNEIELAEYRENLEKMVDERTVKLKSAMAKAEETNRLKSEFLATMSHEIRSPMSGVLGMAELLLDTPLTLEQKALTKTILNSGEVLMNIIEDILDFSKIEANKLELDPIAVNMLELIDDLCLLYSPRAREKALELVVHYVPGTEQFVYADPVRIRQVIGNLISNAIKFTPKGHIIVTVREDQSNQLPDDKVKLVFSVEDTGIGIEEKDKERIFEKFSQANSSTTRDYGGTGLGLSICRKLIELMGGQISVRSQAGKGSCFEFYLSMTRNTEEIFHHPKPPILKDRRILVVDDLAVIRTMLCEQLTAAGLICDTASGGHEALAKLIEARDNGQLYDMMIIDYLMPGMNGEMLARAINDEPDFRDICLIMLTAAGNPIVGDDFAEKGFSAYISKPVKYMSLIESLAVIWGKYADGYKDTLIRVDTASLGAIRNDDMQLRLDGVRVLLVEDSRLNQAFVEEVLAQLACDVTTVSNGQEALDVLDKSAFDLVLMDCQMPVMDGFEATRRICALKKDGKISKNMPVLALTANAMKGDRQRCLDAGMDDYITKPVRKKELKEKIYFWVRREDIGDGGSDAEDEDAPAAQSYLPVSSAEILNMQLFAEAKTLLKDKFDFLLGCYIDDVEAYIREIQDAVSSRNIEGVVRPAHTIKSTSKRIGALKLSDIAKEVELIAREASNANETDMAQDFLESIRLMSTVFEQTKTSLRASGTN